MASITANVRPKLAEDSSCPPLVVELRRAAKLTFRTRYKSGAVLFCEGDTANGVYVLSKGRVKISVSSSAGKTLAFRIAHAGEFLGLYAGLTARPYEATAEMLEDGLIEFIPRGVFTDLMRSQDIAFQLMQVMTDEFFQFMEHARLLLLSQSAAEKLAGLVLKWADDSVECGGRPLRRQRVLCDLTHEQIAEMVGSSRETVSRVLAEFKRQHMITSLDDAMYVENRAALESVARCSWMGNLPALTSADRMDSQQVLS